MARRSERGAALVEYAFFMALVVMVAMGAYDLLDGAARGQYDEATDSAEGNWSSGGEAPPPEEEPEPEPPRSTTTTTTAPTTTTTRPPTTTTTTTTTTPATTTTNPSKVSRVALGSPSAWSTGTWGTGWAGSARVTVTDAAGRALAGAQVQVRISDTTGATRTVTVTTDSRGVATVDVGPYAKWYLGGPTRADLQVVGVTASGATWDGTSGTLGIAAP